MNSRDSLEARLAALEGNIMKSNTKRLPIN